MVSFITQVGIIFFRFQFFEIDWYSLIILHKTFQEDVYEKLAIFLLIPTPTYPKNINTGKKQRTDDAFFYYSHPFVLLNQNQIYFNVGLGGSASLSKSISVGSYPFLPLFTRMMFWEYFFLIFVVEFQMAESRFSTMDCSGLDYTKLCFIHLNSYWIYKTIIIPLCFGTINNIFVTGSLVHYL